MPYAIAGHELNDAVWPIGSMATIQPRPEQDPSDAPLFVEGVVVDPSLLDDEEMQDHAEADPEHRAFKAAVESMAKRKRNRYERVEEDELRRAARRKLDAKREFVDRVDAAFTLRSPHGNSPDSLPIRRRNTIEQLAGLEFFHQDKTKDGSVCPAIEDGIFQVQDTVCDVSGDPVQLDLSPPREEFPADSIDALRRTDLFAILSLDDNQDIRHPLAHEVALETAMGNIPRALACQKKLDDYSCLLELERKYLHPTLPNIPDLYLPEKMGGLYKEPSSLSLVGGPKINYLFLLDATTIISKIMPCTVQFLLELLGAHAEQVRMAEELQKDFNKMLELAITYRHYGYAVSAEDQKAFQSFRQKCGVLNQRLTPDGVPRLKYIYIRKILPVLKSPADKSGQLTPEARKVEEVFMEWLEQRKRLQTQQSQGSQAGAPPRPVSHGLPRPVSRTPPPSSYAPRPASYGPPRPVVPAPPRPVAHAPPRPVSSAPPRPASQAPPRR